MIAGKIIPIVVMDIKPILYFKWKNRNPSKRSFLYQGSGSPMHVDPGLHSPVGKKEFSSGDGTSKGLKKVEEFQEPMQVEEKPIPVLGSTAKTTEKVVSLGKEKLHVHV